ncbi:MAG: hypothetical protein SV760_06970, partial [Halobacteria archaeon]|nr:hypothetical protein [Halobacteria archaeon]
MEPMSYTELDSGYAEDENLQELRQEVHEVARETVRPIGREIDAMSDDEYARVADEGSPYW